jgi:hypothetical protein
VALKRDAGSAVSTRPNTGALASSAWLAARDIFPPPGTWSVNVSLTALDHDARFEVEIFAEEWGFALRRADKQSWIRVTDVPFVHGADDFSLLARTPRLERIHRLIRDIEREHGLHFDRRTARVSSTFGETDAIASWAQSL